MSDWIECVFVCVCVLFGDSGRIMATEFTEEGFSSAGTALTPPSQSGLVAKSAVNLPLCIAE